MVHPRQNDANDGGRRSERERNEKRDRREGGRNESAVGSAGEDEAEHDARDGAQPHDGHAGGALDATLAPSRMK